MKSRAIHILGLLLALMLFTGCSGTFRSASLNGNDISEYTIVYDQSAPDYCQRAAEYIQEQIRQRTGIELPVCEAAAGTYAHEIVVGETDRAISTQLDAATENVEFAILADQDHIALEGDYFVIAAAAYYFVETYIPGEQFRSTVPEEISIHEPITEKANNFIFLIGDGMGVNHTRLFEYTDLPRDTALSDNEDIFYGYYLPYQGELRTDSLSGVTDSAAGATALACGYKTMNGYVGRDSELNDLVSLTELAGSLGKATAVMSTEDSTGATPAGFSAHANDRDDTDDILDSQAQTTEKFGTVFTCGLHYFPDNYQEYITHTLDELDKSENGFFLMYEEAYIDKFSHNWQLEGTFEALITFNQAIGLFMEYAFYNPDTFLIITADHETGGLLPEDDGTFSYNYAGHTGAYVPIFGYGQGAEVFDGFSNENTQVPKVIAALWGVEDFGDN